MDLNTVKALLTEKALARLSGSSHRFCQDPACEIVYFTPTDTFGVGELRVPIWQKQPFGARMVCYCFGENEADIAREIAEHGASRAVERVREHIAAGRCACELRNPRGGCCLGDVIAAVKRGMHECGSVLAAGLNVLQESEGVSSDAPRDVHRSGHHEG